MGRVDPEALIAGEEAARDAFGALADELKVRAAEARKSGNEVVADACLLVARVAANSAGLKAMRVASLRLKHGVPEAAKPKRSRRKKA